MNIRTVRAKQLHSWTRIVQIEKNSVDGFSRVREDSQNPEGGVFDWSSWDSPSCYQSSESDPWDWSIIMMHFEVMPTEDEALTISTLQDLPTELFLPMLKKVLTPDKLTFWEQWCQSGPSLNPSPLGTVLNISHLNTLQTVLYRHSVDREDSPQEVVISSAWPEKYTMSEMHEMDQRMKISQHRLTGRSR